MIYLDHNATTPLRPEAREAMVAAMAVTGNPSSVHGAGRRARAMIETARFAVAEMAGATPADVLFTAGGSEADAQALWGAALAGNLERLIVSPIEHEAVLANARLVADRCGLALETFAVDRNGVADLDDLARRLKTGGRALVALMAANNETGVLQPTAEAARLTADAGGLFFCDAVAAAGRIALPKADYLTLAGHKIGGPMGTGALILAPSAPFGPLLRGGGQERARRAGSENLVGLAGFGAAAAQVVRDGFDVANATARAHFEQGLHALADDAIVFGETAPRLQNTTLFAIPGMAAETALMALDLDGVCVSRGAACAAGKVGASHVLAAMGVPATLARSVLRVSFGWNNAPGDAGAALAALAHFRRARTGAAAA